MHFITSIVFMLGMTLTAMASRCGTADVYAIVQSSDSQGCYTTRKMRDFIADQLVPYFATTVDPSNVRFGAAFYNSEVYSQVGVDWTITSTTVRESLFKWECKLGASNPADAFQQTRFDLLANQRSGVPTTVIWLSDGSVDAGYADPVSVAKGTTEQFGTRFVCVGVPGYGNGGGTVNVDRLNQLCGAENVIVVKNIMTLTLTNEFSDFVNNRIQCFV